jgi:hypothetical protein
MGRRPMCWLIPYGLPAFIIIEVQLRQPREHGLTFPHLERGLDAAANDLFGRDAINFFRPGAHELDAAAGNDESLETVHAQVGEQFDHRLIDHSV